MGKHNEQMNEACFSGVINELLIFLSIIINDKVMTSAQCVTL